MLHTLILGTEWVQRIGCPYANPRSVISLCASLETDYTTDCCELPGMSCGVRTEGTSYQNTLTQASRGSCAVVRVAAGPVGIEEKLARPGSQGLLMQRSNEREVQG